MMPSPKGKIVKPQSDQKAKKLEWYADMLASDAATKEKSGKIQDAIEDYLKAADILLLLTRNEADYSVWKRYSDKITTYQHKVRLLVK